MDHNLIPPLTQEPVCYINSVPDKEYPLRILKTYRKNAESKFANSLDTQGNPIVDNSLWEIMNKHQDERIIILDEAISVLEKFYESK